MAQSWADRILSALRVAETALVVLAFATILGLLMADITQRELVGSSIHGAQRTSVYAMILIAFLGIGLATAHGRHLRPRFADGLLPGHLSIVATRIGDVIMALVWFSFAWLSLKFVFDAFEFQDTARVIDVPLWPLYLVMPYAFASNGLRHTLFALYPTLRPKEIAQE